MRPSFYRASCLLRRCSGYCEGFCLEGVPQHYPFLEKSCTPRDQRLLKDGVNRNLFTHGEWTRDPVAMLEAASSWHRAQSTKHMVNDFQFLCRAIKQLRLRKFLSNYPGKAKKEMRLYGPHYWSS
ncbi:hypothetical protein L484_025163 [Morus notabilis]|uniref:Uncharacterized protein n=1 Tax=Morus notabilis TaxID=981085 RepID=W9RL78_9ROSA|nr:hypothetical protein L484_025163 [Morus notabilis]